MSGKLFGELKAELEKQGIVCREIYAERIYTNTRNTIELLELNNLKNFT